MQFWLGRLRKGVEFEYPNAFWIAHAHMVSQRELAVVECLTSCQSLLFKRFDPGDCCILKCSGGQDRRAHG
ncbi:hypothetical protein C664_08748 [Thauera sp. 63]|nr:hypothetical protein C664_08748 [Thauera sp. 63]